MISKDSEKDGALARARALETPSNSRTLYTRHRPCGAFTGRATSDIVLYLQNEPDQDATCSKIDSKHHTQLTSRQPQRGSRTW